MTQMIKSQLLFQIGLKGSTTTLYRYRENPPECQRFAVHDEACTF